MGICCGFGEGGYTIYYGTEEPIESKFQNKKEETQSFGNKKACPPPCNGNGNFFEAEIQVLDVVGRSPQCQCFNCYSGSQCEIKSPIEECVVDASSVELGLCKEVIPVTDVASDSDFRTDYQSYKTIKPPSETSNNPAKQLDYALYMTLIKLHELANNAVTDGYTLVVGLGANQLVQAANHALHKLSDGGQSAVYNQAPYWSKFPRMINYFGGMTEWVDRAVAEATNPADLIEIVVSPSNPMNQLAADQDPILARKDRQVWDLVYYWPSSYADKSKIVPLEEDIMIFSLSKLAGFSGHRFAWAWVKDKVVADEMADFVSVTTQAYPVDQFLYNIKMLQLITESIGTDKDFFVLVQEELMSRCMEIKKVVDGKDGFSMASECGNMYSLVECDGDCAEIFEAIDLEITSGPDMGIGPNSARLAFGYERAWFDTIIEKLKLLVLSFGGFSSNVLALLTNVGLFLLGVGLADKLIDIDLRLLEDLDLPNHNVGQWEDLLSLLEELLGNI